ncbi:putative lipoprotein [Enhygromyxa salina]|uniref:Putative lipoprotein n=1 Tax=Enhygromyxa salina TaxID=215803 RepID=A0A0C2A1S9_9BACT|nr:hypothetical protein [Enhygromyxa salina]KIG17328.1 putative lipoprotein [Enhygromyxa salina]
MARLNLRPFLPLFLAAAGCGQEFIGDELDELGDGETAADTDPGTDPGTNPDPEPDPEPAPDYEDLTELEYATLRAQLYCEAVRACEPDAACNIVPGTFMAGDCEGYSRVQASTCLTDADNMLAAMNASPSESECVAAMNPVSCGAVLFTDESKETCIPPGNEEGRPIREQGHALLPTLVSGNGWAQGDCDLHNDRAARAWTRAAQSEHGSIPAFARLSQELMAHAAPPQLIARCHAAALDEIAHAQLCLDMARSFGAGEIDFGALPMPKPRVATLEELALEALEEGCLGEGVAAMRARISAERSSGKVSAVLTQIAEDETRHAELAWATLDWMLGQDASLAPILTARLAQLEAQREVVDPSTDGPMLERFGLLQGSTRAAVSNAVLDQIIAPTLRCLIAKHTRAQASAAAVA